MENQDQKIFSLIVKNQRGLIILVNKFDLINNKKEEQIKIEKKIKEKIAPFVDVPIIFTSVVNKQRILKSIELAVNVYNKLSFKISTSHLNKYMLSIIENNPPPSTKGKRIKIKYITQLPTKRPSFAFFCNLPQYIKESYKRFLENKLRDEFDFKGVPLQLFFRKK
tara:strand:- start:878 stop:1375 length:498 start_codon:yes stop_codon:yes gene_type:complete